MSHACKIMARQLQNAHDFKEFGLLSAYLPCAGTVLCYPDVGGYMDSPAQATGALSRPAALSS